MVIFHCKVRKVATLITVQLVISINFFGRASIFFVFAMLISLKVEHYIYINIIHEQKIKVRLMGN